MSTRTTQTQKVTLESVLRSFAIISISLLVFVLTVAAWTTWEERNHFVSGPVSLNVLVEQVGVALPPAQAADRLRQTVPVKSHETYRSELPVWFSFNIAEVNPEADYVEFPSRHAVEIACWDVGSTALVGRADRDAANGAIERVKAGFALKLTSTPRPTVCKARFQGPASLSAKQWSARDLQASTLFNERQSGLLDGGIIVLALFVLTIAIVNAQPIYVLFAGWLVLNLRVAALSAGWDIQWLGHTIPADWLLQIRALTLALYAIATLTLYQALFKSDLVNSRFAPAFRFAEWWCFPLLAAAVLLPYPRFLPILWGCTAYGLGLMIIVLATVIRKSSTRKAAWFTLALSVAFLCSLAEVIAAALGAREVLSFVNSLTAAIASSLLAALALAEELRAETARRIEAQQQLEHTYEAMPVGLFTLDLSGRFLSSNPLLVQMLSGSVIVEHVTRVDEFFAAEACEHLIELVNSQINAELQVDSLDGSKQFLIKATLSRGKIEGFVQDITDQVKANDQLHFLANNDPLTKALNRRGIEKIYNSAMVNVTHDSPLCLAYLDLDRFKLINDLFGHNAGDEVLKEVCERVKAAIASEYHFGRVGGDEFVLVLPNTALALASIVCRGIVDRIGNFSYRVGGKAFHVRGSIGLIEIVQRTPMKDAVSTADRACVEAKRGVSDGLTIYKHNAIEMREHEAELDLVAKLTKSGATEGLFLEMRPILSLSDPYGSINFEAVLHMHQAHGGTLPVAPIIAAAEKSGQAGLIDRWVLSHALEWIRTNWHALGSTQFICVKLAGASLNDERFVQDAIGMLEENAHLTARLCLGVSESVALYDLTNTRRFIEQVRDTGARVALDDFGAGFTSFSYLMEFPADVLKIDGRFIKDVNASPANVAIIEAIVRLANNLGMKTVAHHADSAETVRRLAEIGVDYVQGFGVNRRVTTETPFIEAPAASYIADDELAEVVRLLSDPANALP